MEKLYRNKRRLHCADESYARTITIYTAWAAIQADGMDEQKIKNAIMAGIFFFQNYILFTPKRGMP